MSERTTSTVVPFDARHPKGTPPPIDVYKFPPGSDFHDSALSIAREEGCTCEPEFEDLVPVAQIEGRTVHNILIHHDPACALVVRMDRRN